MGRKSKSELYFDRHKQTLYSAVQSCVRPGFYEEDKLFCILILSGYPATRAYSIAYPQSKASQSSMAALASRRLQENNIQLLLANVADAYWRGLICLKDKPLPKYRKGWPSYMGRKNNKIDPN